MAGGSSGRMYMYFRVGGLSRKFWSGESLHVAGPGGPFRLCGRLEARGV